MTDVIGQNWLLLRGLSREAAHWGDFLPLLQTHFPSAAIATLDLPGTGQFYKQTSPCDMGLITDAVRRQALEQGLLAKPLTIVGLSLGGMVAWEWSRRFPGDVSGAVLINSSLASLSPFYRRLRWQTYPKLFELLAQPDRYHRELAIIRTVANRRELDAQTAERWSEIQRLRPVSLATTLRQIVAAARYCPGDEKPRIPVLLLNSLGDRLVAPSCSVAIQRQWHLPLASHPWGGHDLTLDDGEWVAECLRRWVEQADQT